MYGKAILLFSIVFVNIEPEMVAGDKTTNLIPRGGKRNKENDYRFSIKTGSTIPRLFRSKKEGLWQKRVNQLNTILKHETVAENEGENYMNLFLKLLHDTTEVQHLIRETATEPAVDINASDDMTFLSPELHFSLFDRNSDGLITPLEFSEAWKSDIQAIIQNVAENSVR